jgi:hypothetical protein
MLHSPGENLSAESTMNLTRMMTDKVFFEDKNGTRSGPYKTKFGTDRITVFQDELNVTEGDRVIQPLSNGTEQVYIVEAVAYGAARHNVPGHYSITIVKEATSLTPDTSVASTAARVHGSNVQVGNNNNESIVVSIQSLAEGIENTSFPTGQKEEAKRLLRTLIEHPVVAAILRARM